MIANNKTAHFRKAPIRLLFALLALFYSGGWFFIHHVILSIKIISPSSKVFSVSFILVGALMGGFIVIQRTTMDGLIFIALAKME